MECFVPCNYVINSGLNNCTVVGVARRVHLIKKRELLHGAHSDPQVVSAGDLACWCHQSL